MFSNKLKTLRKNKNWSQVDLSRKIEVSQPVIAAYENNAKMPNSDTIKKIAQVFGVSTDYLLGITEEKKEIPSSQNKEEIDLTEVKKNFQEKTLTYGGKKLPKNEEEIIRRIILAVIEREEDKLKGH